MPQHLKNRPKKKCRIAYFSLERFLDKSLFCRFFLFFLPIITTLKIYIVICHCNIRSKKSREFVSDQREDIILGGRHTVTNPSGNSGRPTTSMWASTSFNMSCYVVKRSFPWQVGKQKQKIKPLTQQYQLWLMTNEEGEGRRDKILDMEASTNGYGRGRECREK